MTKHVAVLGATGFVGSAVADAIGRVEDVAVARVTAPRLSTPARNLVDVRRGASEHVADLARRLEGAEVIINAAGIADAAADGDDELFGANALLPAAIVACLQRLGPQVRFVHVSSAAVQGRRHQLDESPEVSPFSPYSRAKALGEQAVAGRSGTVVFRPTSVHGPRRDVTRRLVKFMASGFASVAGDGSRHTPQVLVENVAAAIAHVALTSAAPPSVVLQPSENMTTGRLVEVLSGRQPRHIPVPLARAAVVALTLGGRHTRRVAGIARRLEMLWFGQRQSDSWLTAQGFTPPVGIEGWTRLGVKE